MSTGQENTPRSREPRARFKLGPLLVVFAVTTLLYFIVVWRYLPSDGVRWVTMTSLFAVMAVFLVAALMWNWFGERLGGVLNTQVEMAIRWAALGGDFLIFVGIVVGVLAAAVYLDRTNQVFVLKVFSVLYFSLLPAVLYIQFSSRRAMTVWREYVLNLFRLHVDDYAHLPRPPTLSRFHEPWRRARDKAWQRARGTSPKRRVPRQDSRNLEKANIYRRKFQDLFGPLPEEEPKHFVSLRSPHKLQVAMTTVLVAIGWSFVVQPETVFHRSFTPQDFDLAGLPVIPRETFAFAFLGAYFYILQMLVRRYFQNDLKATAYLSATMRIIIVTLLVWTIDPLLEGETSQATRSALAFVIGVFPTIGWQALTQLLVRKPFHFVVPSLEPRYPLSDLDGLNIWYESRLLEEGIEDMQNLATADLVDVMLNTRIPVERLIDWVDQSLLYLHCAEADRATLRRYGIRSATDLLDAFAGETNGSAAQKRFCKELERLLNFADGRDDGRPSVMRAIRVALATERNLQHVVAWKSFRSDEADDTNVALPSEVGSRKAGTRARRRSEVAVATNGRRHA